MKHTPGPWKAERIGGSYHCTKEKGMAFRILSAAGGQTVSRLIVLDRREFKRLWPDAAGIFDPPEYPGSAVVPRGASTRVRLHELGHMQLGHTTKDIINGMDLDEYIDREVAADAYAVGILRREFTTGSMNNIIEQAIDATEGSPDPNFCVLRAFRSLEKRHIKVTSSWRNQVRRGVRRGYK